MSELSWDEEADLVVVGSGAGGMAAALRGAEQGKRVVVLEREARWGGTSAWSGGGMWLPCNPLMARDGEPDSPEDALRYMDTVIGDVGPASSPERRRAFVETAAQVVPWLEQHGMPVLRASEYPDYYPDKPGGRIGRGVELDVFNERDLGPWAATLSTMDPTPYIAMTTKDVFLLPRALRTWRGFAATSGVMLRTIGWFLSLRKPLGIGMALMARLTQRALELGVDLRLSSPLVELVTQDGAVVGVVCEQGGVRKRIRALRGVVLAAGGFAKNDTLRRTHQPVGGEYTSVAPGDQGEAILLGTELGAAVALMDDAWWGGSFLDADGNPMFSVTERSMPHCILVNEAGQRFTNESASYIDVGHAMLAQNPGGPPPPFWLILDARHRRRYLFGMAPPGITPKSWLASENLFKAPTLDALAVQCGINGEGLKATVARFNTFAAVGVDEDFQRGRTAYDNYYGDPTVKPNPNLGAIEQGPFYAVRMVPGDLGTKGGLLTDEHARVLTPEQRPIPGLYATGNSTASVMGRTYPGPGSTLGPAVVFGMRGVDHALGQ